MNSDRRRATHPWARRFGFVPLLLVTSIAVAADPAAAPAAADPGAEVPAEDCAAPPEPVLCAESADEVRQAVDGVFRRLERIHRDALPGPTGVKVRVVRSTVAQVLSKTEPANDG